MTPKADCSHGPLAHAGVDFVDSMDVMVNGTPLS